MIIVYETLNEASNVSLSAAETFNPSEQVIYEPSFFYVDKLDVLPLDSIVKLCDDAYTDLEVLDAKLMLAKSGDHLLKGKYRRRNGQN